MKETFFPAEMNLILFVHQDVITASGRDGDNTVSEEHVIG